MQKSIGVQKQAIQRQTRETFEDGFFSLPEPATLPRSPGMTAAPEADPGNTPDDVQDQEDGPAEPAEHPRAKQAGIATIGGIAAIADLVPLSPLGESSMEGILLKELTGSGQQKPGASGLPAGLTKLPQGLSKEDAFDFVRQFLSVGTGGSALLQGLADDH